MRFFSHVSSIQRKCIGVKRRWEWLNSLVVTALAKETQGSIPSPKNPSVFNNRDIWRTSSPNTLVVRPVPWDVRDQASNPSSESGREHLNLDLPHPVGNVWAKGHSRQHCFPEYMDGTHTPL